MSVLAKNKHFKAKSFWHSVGYALEGLGYAVTTQRNFRIDLVFTLLAIGMGAFLGIEALEWIAIAFAIALVLSAELLNTALELAVDMWTQGQYNQQAKHIKDVAAAACLMMAMMSLLIGMIIFLPKVLYRMESMYS